MIQLFLVIRAPKKYPRKLRKLQVIVVKRLPELVSAELMPSGKADIPCDFSVTFDTLLIGILIFTGSHACETTEIFGKERGIGKVHILGYLRCRLVCVAQFYFDASDESTVYPVFGGSAAGLADNGAQVALGEAHALGIVAYLVLFVTVLGNQLKETVEDSLLARTAACQLVGLLMKQMVVVVHLGCYEGRDGGTMIVV